METIGIEITRLFVKVVQHGGFTKASKILQVPKSTISKAISRLEAETGTKLLVRTTRSQTLTAAGRIFYETCLGPLQTLEDAQKSLFGQDNIVSGIIKITAPEDLGTLVITPAIAKLSLKYPMLNFETVFTNEIIDLVKDGYDLGVRIGLLQESRLKQKKVGEIEVIPVAAPSYLRTVGKITTPKDLEKLDGLILRTGSLLNQWVLKNDRKTSNIKINARIRCNHMSSVIAAAMTGAGVALVPSYLVSESLKSGELIRLLPNWLGTLLPVSIVSPVSMISSSRLNIISSEITEALRVVLK